MLSWLSIIAAWRGCPKLLQHALQGLWQQLQHPRQAQRQLV
jgi:hypothetical protein